MTSYILNTNKGLPPVLLPAEKYHVNPLDNTSRNHSVSSASSGPCTSFSSVFSSASSPPASHLTTLSPSGVGSPFNNGNNHKLPSPLPFSPAPSSLVSYPIAPPNSQAGPAPPAIATIPGVTTSFVDNLPSRNSAFCVPVSPSPTSTVFLLSPSADSPQSSSQETGNATTDTPRSISLPRETNQIILDFGANLNSSQGSASALEISSTSLEPFHSNNVVSKFGRSFSTSSSPCSSSVVHKNGANRRRHSSKLIVESFNDTIHNKLKKRQRNGPSCDNCRIKKIKCDAKIIILKKLNKSFVKPNKLVSHFDPANYGISNSEYLKIIEYYKVLNNDFEDSGFTFFESGNNLIQFKDCTCCSNKKLQCEFSKGFTKADILEYNKKI